MKKLLLLLLAGAFMLSSCDKQDTDLTVTLKNSGKLKVKLAGDDGKGIADTKLQLFLYYSSGSSSSAYDTKKTNSDGKVDFGQLIENIYYIVSKDVKVDGVKYFVNKPVMVTSGLDDEIVINPQDFTGKVTIDINKYSISGYTTKGANLNIALIERTDYSDTLTHAEKLAKAAMTGVTNSLGQVVFEKVPSNYEFIVYVYIDADQNVALTNSNYVYSYKDDERSYSFTVNESDLSNVKVNVDLTVYYYDYNYNTKYLSNANVIVVKYNDYYNYSLSYQSLDVVKNYQVASGITNSSGKVTLSLRSLKEYKILVYKSSSLKTWCYSTLYTVNSNSTFSAEVDESYLGLK